jgi:cytoskeleton protein RodZ
MAEIGSTLREARMRAHIDITEVETRTKIRAKYLRAIENEEWDLLPGPIYAKSFLRTYGDFLGLDSRMLVDEFRRRYERPSDQEMRPLAPLGREPERTGRGPVLPPWALIGLVLVAVVVILYVIGSGGGKNKTQPTGVKPNKAHRKHHKKATPSSKPTSVKLQLVPTGPVYVCLIDGKGTKLINQQTFSPGQTIPTQTSNKLLLTLGNASVHVKVNGHAVSIAPSANPIRYVFEPSGHHAIALTAKPSCP